jgi:ABC-2 type transport system permease protein
MRATRIYAVFLRQIYLIRGSMTRVIPLFIWVAIDIVLWGFITKYLNSVNGMGFDFVPTMLGAMLLWGFLVRVMQGVTMAFFEDVWSRNFLNIFSSPITIYEYVVGLVLSSIATSAVGLAVMLLLAHLFGLSFTSYGIMLYPFLLTLFIFGLALGILGTALVLRWGPAAEWFIWPIPALISPFVGVLYPLSVLPAWMQAVGHALPASYVFESMRAIILQQSVAPLHLFWAITLAVLYLLAAGWCFSRVYAYALRTGLIARYSAENVS